MHIPVLLRLQLCNQVIESLGHIDDTANRMIPDFRSQELLYIIQRGLTKAFDLEQAFGVSNVDNC